MGVLNMSGVISSRSKRVQTRAGFSGVLETLHTFYRFHLEYPKIDVAKCITGIKPQDEEVCYCPNISTFSDFGHCSQHRESQP